MTFIIYPDAATAKMLGKPDATPVHLAPGETMQAFVPLAGLAGPDPAAPGFATTFIRIAVSGPEVSPDMQPTIELRAHHPSGANGDEQVIDPNAITSLGSAVLLKDGVNVGSAALAHFSPPYTDNVYLLKVVIQIADTTFSLKITNTTGVERDLVWVVAANDGASQQPWIHAAPENVELDGTTGQTAPETAQPIRIANRGTGGVTVDAVMPAIAAPYVMSGLPLTLGANTSVPANISVGFDAPSVPGNIPPKGYTFVTSNKTDPGPFGAGHNDKLRLGARASFAEPRFAASPNQFDRKRGLGPDPMTGSEEQVRLFGANFHQPISVFFGEVPAIGAFPQSSSTIVATIPEMEPATVKIKVVAAGGAVTSDDLFRVSPWPVIDDFEGFSRDPSGQEFEIFGRHFVDEESDSVAVACSMTERSDGITQPESLIVWLTVVSFDSTRITVAFPEVPEVDRFVGSNALYALTRSDGAFVESEEWEIKGL